MTWQWVPDKHLRFYQLFVLTIAVVWGIDYLITPEWAIGTALSVIERAFPLYVWGVFFLSAGLLGFVGEAWLEYCRRLEKTARPWPGRRKRDRIGDCLTASENQGWLSYIAHAGLLALYASLGLGYLLNLIVEWHIWGLRAPVLMWGFAAAHWIFMNRRKRVRVLI